MRRIRKGSHMVKDIIKDDSILSQKCDKATEADAEVIQDLLDTLGSLDEAACLAANQIGITKAIGVYRDEDDGVHVVLNPTIRKALYPVRTYEECYSHDEDSKVTRYGWCQVEMDDYVDGKLVHRRREFEGRNAQVVQHLIDHCKGKLV